MQSQPCRFSKNAVTALSTPPLMATRTLLFALGIPPVALLVRSIPVLIRIVKKEKQFFGLEGGAIPSHCRFFRSVSYYKQFLRYRRVHLIPYHIPAGRKAPLGFAPNGTNVPCFLRKTSTPPRDCLFLSCPYTLLRGSAQNDNRRVRVAKTLRIAQPLPLVLSL